MSESGNKVFLTLKQIAANEVEQKRLLEAQKVEIKSAENFWYAGIELGHTPTLSEAAMHYITNGGAEDFRKGHSAAV